MSDKWRTSNRRSELPPDWSTRIVPEVKRRAKDRCEWPGCGEVGVEVDHVDSGPVGRHDHAYTNLQLLCKTHHRSKTLEEAAAGRRRYLSPKRREPHPGER